MGIEVVMLKARPTSSITRISQSMYSKFWYIHKLDSNQILYKYSMWLWSIYKIIKWWGILLFADWPKQNFLNSTSEWVYLVCSEYTSYAVSTPRMRYIRACVYFCLLFIRCFNVVQPETRFHFQSANQITKEGQFFFQS